ncbi:hypothetical protein MPH_14096 [Macrophomina phaseolina MS6]|uniref:Uncharacterized protein n=1 Tax=Macrophomina phaseolina (strain MS6) TaxID=1126212 RepID=K2QGR4_MACPH|nr:hypothetical protein MPH_14096 [Macrophomina phaseolina MS6]
MTKGPPPLYKEGNDVYGDPNARASTWSCRKCCGTSQQTTKHMSKWPDVSGCASYSNYSDRGSTKKMLLGKIANLLKQLRLLQSGQIEPIDGLSRKEAPKFDESLPTSIT